MNTLDWCSFQGKTTSSKKCLTVVASLLMLHRLYDKDPCCPSICKGFSLITQLSGQGLCIATGMTALLFNSCSCDCIWYLMNYVHNLAIIYFTKWLDSYLDLYVNWKHRTDCTTVYTYVTDVNHKSVVFACLQLLATNSIYTLYQTRFSYFY